MRRFGIVVLLVFALPAFSQDVLDMRPKHAKPVDGSFAITQGHGTGFDLNLGGTAVKDRVWFFASVDRSQPMFATPLATSPVRAIDTKAIANIGDRQNLSATFASQSAPTALSLPTNFLSLHYTATVTSNSFFTMNFSQSRTQ